MNAITIELDGDQFHVGLAHTTFPNDGGWSYFVCPNCRRIARILRKLGDRLVCKRCDGLFYRCQLGDRGVRRRDKGPAIERLKKLVYGPPARLYPGWQGHAALAHRDKLELKLRRALLMERKKRLKGWTG